MITDPYSAGNLSVLAELRRRPPHAMDWATLSDAGVVQMLDDSRRRAVTACPYKLLGSC